MKIVTWNVNGIRAALGKNALDRIWQRSPDVLFPWLERLAPPIVCPAKSARGAK